MTRHFNQAFNFHADAPSGYWEQARQYREERDYQAAETVLRKGVEHFPQSARLWSELGKRLARTYDIDRDDEAMECFERSYNLAPNDQLIASDYAAFLFKKGFEQESEITYLRAFDDMNEGHWKNIRVLCGLGDIYQKMHNYEYAAICFGRACKMDDSDDFAARRFAEVVIKHGATYSDNGWDDYYEYAQSLINEAGPAPEPAGIDNIPR